MTPYLVVIKIILKLFEYRLYANGGGGGVVACVAKPDCRKYRNQTVRSQLAYVASLVSILLGS